MDITSLDEQQALAIKLCTDATKRLVGVTGAAGSGKTTIMRYVYEELTARGLKGALVAPTGKAARRIQEATGIEAFTIHRLLRYTHPGDPDPKTGKPIGVSVPTMTRDNPLELDFVLADEYMMVNIELNRNLIDAIPPGGVLRVFGDANQLPPIEPNSFNKPEYIAPFVDILTRFESVRLEKNHRQGSGSGIATNGQRILKGMCPVSNDETTIVITDQQVQKLVNLVKETGTLFAQLDNQIITPLSKNVTGAKAINAVLQPLFHPTMDGAQSMPRNKWDEDQPLELLVNDKVIFTENDYNLDIFNGEVGIVTDITEFGEVTVNFGDRTILIPPVVQTENKNGDTISYDPRKKLQLAYVLTTHKTQGSEYQHVIYMMSRGGYILQIRSNFYTGTSRARTKLTIISDLQSFQRSPSMIKSPTFASKKKA